MSAFHQFNRCDRDYKSGEIDPDPPQCSEPFSEIDGKHNFKLTVSHHINCDRTSYSSK
ncbi:MAG: hypothetical protein ACP5D7_04190 [Limnospira sp.]